MISIRTKVKPADAREIIEWAIQFAGNTCSDFILTDFDLNQAADYCVEGQDAWEAAAAIQEKRKLGKIKK